MSDTVPVIITSIPDWSTLKYTLRTTTIINTTLSGREERTPRQYRPIFTTTYDSNALSNEERKTIKGIFESRTVIQSFVPLWMDACQLSQTAPRNAQSVNIHASGRLFSWFKYALIIDPLQKISEIIIPGKIDSANNIVYLYGEVDGIARATSTLQNTYSTSSLVVPLMFGLTQIPKFSDLGNYALFSISFTEKEGHLLYNPSVSGYKSDGLDSLNNGDSYANYETWRCKDETDNTIPDVSSFLLSPNYVNYPQSTVDSDVYFEPMDVGAASAFQLNTVDRKLLSFKYTMNRTQLQRLIDQFTYCHGTAKSFYLPSWANDKTSSDTDVYGVNAGKIVTDSTAQHYCSKLKARFNSDSLTITTPTPFIAETTVQFIETDKATIADTVNERQCFLYVIGNNKFTNYGYGVDYGTNGNFIPADITHDEIEYSTDLLGDTINITVAGLASDNVALFDSVTIYKTTINSQTGNRNSVPTKTDYSELPTLFTGKITAIETKEHGKLTLTVSSKMTVLTRDMPSFLIGRQCNWSCGDAFCGITPKSITITRTENKKGTYNWTIEDNNETKVLQDVSTFTSNQSVSTSNPEVYIRYKLQDYQISSCNVDTQLIVFLNDFPISPAQPSEGFNYITFDAEIVIACKNLTINQVSGNSSKFTFTISSINSENVTSHGETFTQFMEGDSITNTSNSIEYVINSATTDSNSVTTADVTLETVTTTQTFPFSANLAITIPVMITAYTDAQNNTTYKINVTDTAQTQWEESLVGSTITINNTKYIVTNKEVTATSNILTLNKDIPSGTSTGTIIPFCNKRFNSCLNFSNHVNFGGFPIKPTSNPINNYTNDEAGSSKK